MDLFAFNPATLASFLMTLMRVSLLVFLLPFYGGEYIPAMVKAALCLVLSLALWPHLSFPGDLMPENTGGLLLMLLGELILGLVMALCVNFVFAAIQTGVVDGWMGGPPNLNYLNYRDLIKYYYQYNFTHEATQIYMNQKKFQSLLPEDQKVLEEAIQKQCAGSLASAKADDDKYNKLMADMGIKVHYFTTEELELMAKGVRENVWPKLAKTYTQEFLDQLLDSLK